VAVAFSYFLSLWGEAGGGGVGNDRTRNSDDFPIFVLDLDGMV